MATFALEFVSAGVAFLVTAFALLLIYKKLYDFPRRRFAIFALGFTLIFGLILAILITIILWNQSQNFALLSLILRVGFAIAIVGGYLWFVILSSLHLKTRGRDLAFFIFSTLVFFFAATVNLLTITYAAMENGELVVHYNPFGILPLTYVGAVLMLLLEKQVNKIKVLTQDLKKVEMQPFNPKFWLFKFRAFFTATAVFFFIGRTFPGFGIPVFLWTIPFFGGIFYFAFAIFNLPVPVLNELDSMN